MTCRTGIKGGGDLNHLTVAARFKSFFQELELNNLSTAIIKDTNDYGWCMSVIKILLYILAIQHMQRSVQHMNSPYILTMQHTQSSVQHTNSLYILTMQHMQRSVQHKNSPYTAMSSASGTTKANGR